MRRCSRYSRRPGDPSVINLDVDIKAWEKDIPDPYEVFKRPLS